MGGGGSYLHTLHTFRGFKCILQVNGGMKIQKSRHTFSYHFPGMPNRSFIKSVRKSKDTIIIGGQQGPVPLPPFIKELTKIMSDRSEASHGGGWLIPAYFAYFQRF